MRSHRDGARAVIALAGEVDGRAGGELIDEFAKAVSGPDVAEVVLDMANVSFVDSAGLRAVIRVEAEAQKAEVALSVTPPPATVVEVLRTTGLTDRLTLGPQPPHSRDDEGEFTERIELELPRDLRAPARARTEVREAMGDFSDDDLAIAVLLTSEVVTNAVIHTEGTEEDTIGLLITLSPVRLRVQVLDPGAGFDPERPPARAPDQGGRGLLLVDRLSSRWGARPVSEAPRRFAVWFEFVPGTVSLSDEALTG